MQMVVNMKVGGKKTSEMEKDSKGILMEIPTSEISKWEKLMVKEFTHG